MRLTPGTWPMFEAVVDRHDGIFGGCRCTWFHRDSEGRGPGAEGSRVEKQRYVECGVAHAALLVEGYPHVPGEKKMSSSFLDNGTRATYERCGFAFVRPEGLENTVMRRTVEPAG